MTKTPPAPSLRRLGRSGATIALVGAVAVLAVAIGGWWSQPALLHRLGAALPAGVAPEAEGLPLAWAISLVPAMAFAGAMCEAALLFSRLGRVRLIEIDVPARVRRLGLWALAIAVLGVLSRMGVALTLSGRAGPPQLVVGIDASEIAALVMGLLLLSFAAVLSEALVIEDDMRGIV